MSNTIEEAFWHFDLDYVEFIDQFEENYHLENIKTPIHKHVNTFSFILDLSIFSAVFVPFRYADCAFILLNLLLTFHVFDTIVNGTVFSNVIYQLLVACLWYGSWSL